MIDRVIEKVRVIVEARQKRKHAPKQCRRLKFSHKKQLREEENFKWFLRSGRVQRFMLTRWRIVAEQLPT